MTRNTQHPASTFQSILRLTPGPHQNPSSTLATPEGRSGSSRVCVFPPPPTTGPRLRLIASTVATLSLRSTSQIVSHDCPHPPALLCDLPDLSNPLVRNGLAYIPVTHLQPPHLIFLFLHLHCNDSLSDRHIPNHQQQALLSPQLLSTRPSHRTLTCSPAIPVIRPSSPVTSLLTHRTIIDHYFSCPTTSISIHHPAAIMRSRSGSATSNTSSKELPADNMAIQVTIGGGKSKFRLTADAPDEITNKSLTAIKLNVRPVHTVSNVLEFLSASTNLPAGVQLILDGKPLEPSTTVGELKLEESSTIKLSSSRGTTPTEPSQPQSMVTEMTTTTLPSTSTSSTPTTSGTATPTKRKSNKPRCSKDGCKTPAQPIVGDCGFCQKRFCGKHRMLESHNCEGLEDARRADKDRNTAKLEGERTVMLRGL